MSQNQSKNTKVEGNLRKSGRSGNFGPNQGFCGDGQGGGGGASAPLPAFPSSTAPRPLLVSSELLTNQSFKNSVREQGAQFMALSNSNSDATHQAVLNGTCKSVSSHGPSDGLTSKSAKLDSLNGKKILRAVPKAPAAQIAAATTVGESTPFLQFGTINPGIVKGMQVPARTCSAPPNLDEQKSDQVRRDSLGIVPAVTTPSAPSAAPRQQKQQMVKYVNQADIRESHSPANVKRDMMHAPIPSAPSAAPTRPLPPVGGKPMQIPFQQPQIPVQFSGPNMQMPQHGDVPTSFQITMPLSVGNVPQVPQPMFVPSIQSHPLQPQAIMHQGQNLGFVPQFGHQLPPQLSSMGIGITQQFPQQQPGNFVSQRRAVKITHPETHEELKLDKKSVSLAGPSGQRQLPNTASQSSSLPSFNHQISYYPTTYNHSQMFFSSPSSLPLTSTQMTAVPQAGRYSYPVGQNGQPISFTGPSPFDPAIGGKPNPLPPSHGLLAVKSEGSSFSVPLGPSHISVRPAPLLPSEKSGTSSVRISMPVTKPEPSKLTKLPGDVHVAPHQKDEEVCYQSTGLTQKQNCEPLINGSFSSKNDKKFRTLSSTSSTVSSASETCSSLLHIPVSDAFTTIVVENDIRKAEDLLISKSVLEEQNSLNKMELKITQQQTDSLVGPSRSNDSASEGTPLTADSLIYVASPSKNRDCIISELDQKKEKEGDSGFFRSTLENEPSQGSGSFRSTFEKEPSQGASSSVSDPVEASGCALSFVDTCHLEESTSPNTIVDGILRTLDFSSGTCKILEVGDKLESPGSECMRDGVCDCDLLSTSSAFTSIIGYSDETSMPANQKVVTDSSIKEVVELCGSDNLNFACPEEVGSNVSSIMGTTVVLNMPTTTLSDSKGTEPIPYGHVPFNNFNEDAISDSTINKHETLDSEDVASSLPCILVSEMASMPSLSSEIKVRPEVKPMMLCNGAQTTSVLSGPAERISLEPNRTRNNKKGKNKFYSKADAACSSDLYNAYKRPEEKLEAAGTLETIENSSTAKSNISSVEDLNSVVMAVEQDEQSKSKFEDWEATANASSSKLRESENGELDHAEKKIQVEYDDVAIGKKSYSRDFLLTFSEQCKDLPDGFDIGSDLTNIMSLSVGMKRVNDYDSIASPRRITDRSSGPSRGDRRMATISDGDRWTKSNALRMDHSHEIAGMNFRPVQGVNNGVLRNPSVTSTNQFSGGIISGPLHSFPSLGGIARNNSDLDRWQRATGTQRGLIPPPQGLVQVMHKSASRYIIGKVSDEEEQKQRRLKGILNKLTPQNFEKLFAQVKEVNIDNTVTLTGVISQIFDKALMEPTFCEMYADFCFHLASELPDIAEENEKITFRRLLLNKCQEEFERGEIEQAEADKADEEGEIHQTEDEREEKRIRVRRRMLGNIRLIGELYKKKMLTERIMHECMQKLLGQYHNPDEENIEALCKLMSTIGEMIDHSKAREHMDFYFDVMTKLSTNQKLSSRVRFMLKDTIDLRRNRWRQRRKVEGPKKIEDVHRDAAQERQAQASKPGRGPSMSSRRGAPADYGHRGSTILSSINSHSSGSIRGLPGHVRGSSSQDARLNERYQLESKVLSLPLPHRPTYDGSVTLGPQGGLAKGMSSRGVGVISNSPLAEVSPRIDISHRLTSGLNGFSSISTTDCIPSISRYESMPKFMTGGSSGERNDQDPNSGETNDQDPNSIFGISGSHFPDRASDRSSAATSGRRPTSSGGKISASSELKALSEDTLATSGRRPTSSGGKISASSELKALSEDTLREKSISAIREFYSAKDEKEIVLCIKDLNTPSFYPSMVSLWVTDSFERKNMDQSLLAQLLVNLTKGPDSLIGRAQLIEGFDSVLLSLEDTINDAPKAAEFLGHIFGRVIVENVVQLMEIGKMIHEGGEVPGTLVEAGLGSEILGSVLEFVQMEKGDSFLNSIIVSSNLQLDDFKPPNPSSKTKKLNAFL